LVDSAQLYCQNIQQIKLKIQTLLHLNVGSHVSSNKDAIINQLFQSLQLMFQNALRHLKFKKGMKQKRPYVGNPIHCTL